MVNSVAAARARASAESRLKARSNKPLTQPIGLKSRTPIMKITKNRGQNQDQSAYLKHIKSIISEQSNMLENDISFEDNPSNRQQILLNGCNTDQQSKTPLMKRSTCLGFQIVNMPDRYFNNPNTASKNASSPQTLMSNGKSPALKSCRKSTIFKPIFDSTFNLATPNKKGSVLMPKNTETKIPTPSTSCESFSSQVKRALVFSPKKMVTIDTDLPQNTARYKEAIDVQQNAFPVTLEILSTLLDNFSIDEWDNAVEQLEYNQKEKFNKIAKKSDAVLQNFTKFDPFAVEEVSDKSVPTKGDSIILQDEQQQQSSPKAVAKILPKGNNNISSNFYSTPQRITRSMTKKMQASFAHQDSTTKAMQPLILSDHDLLITPPRSIKQKPATTTPDLLLTDPNGRIRIMSGDTPPEKSARKRGTRGKNTGKTPKEKY